MSEKSKQKWNKKYSAKLEEQGTQLAQPNENLTRFSSYFHGNKVLDIACGLGANSIYLAQQGYQVTALDIADVAIQHINELTTNLELSIQAKVVDLETLFLPEQKYDLIINTFYLQRNLFKPLQQALQSKGYLFIETFYQVEENDPNPSMKKEYKLASQELLQVFKEMKILFYQENMETGIATLFAQK